jgi:hypothetical protein
LRLVVSLSIIGSLNTGGLPEAADFRSKAVPPPRDSQRWV